MKPSIQQWKLMWYLFAREHYAHKLIQLSRNFMTKNIHTVQYHQQYKLNLPKKW